MEALQIVKPQVLILNIKLLNDALQAMLAGLKQNAVSPIILFTTNNDDFHAHLHAIRLGGQGFYIYPIQTEKIAARLDQLFEDQEPHRVLIVDETGEATKQYANLLADHGMIVHTSSEPTKVDEVLSEFKPHIILIDVALKSCSATELATIVRQRDMYHNMPILFLFEGLATQVVRYDLPPGSSITYSTDIKHFVAMVKHKAERYKDLCAQMIKDGLTGTLNHTAIQQRLEVDIKLTSRLNVPMAVAMIDLDYFKKINDNYGHRSGDKVLQYLCVLLNARLRKADAIGRYGGEEFLVILPNTTAHAAKNLLDGIRRQFAKISFYCNKEKFNATFSAGLIICPPYLTTSQVIQKADEAMYIAKNAGGNQVVLANQKTEDR
jgi:diguanylate cyclase (GGDEF)-like protein